MTDERPPFWAYVQPSANDWAPELQQAWVALWTGDHAPRASSVLMVEALWGHYNEIVRRKRGEPTPPSRTPHQYSFAGADDTDLAFEMLEHETLVGLTQADRDRLGITALIA